MFQMETGLALSVEVSGLAALPSVQADDVTGLARKASRRHRASKSNVCLITLNNVLNDADVLSGLLSLFGGGGLGL